MLRACPVVVCKQAPGMLDEKEIKENAEELPQRKKNRKKKKGQETAESSLNCDIKKRHIHAVRILSLIKNVCISPLFADVTLLIGPMWVLPVNFCLGPQHTVQSSLHWRSHGKYFLPHNAPSTFWFFWGNRPFCHTAEWHVCNALAKKTF